MKGELRRKKVAFLSTLLQNSSEHTERNHKKLSGQTPPIQIKTGHFSNVGHMVTHSVCEE
jgi:hypothetical protein